MPPDPPRTSLPLYLSVELLFHFYLYIAEQWFLKRKRTRLAVQLGKTNCRNVMHQIRI